MEILKVKPRTSYRNFLVKPTRSRMLHFQQVQTDQRLSFYSRLETRVGSKGPSNFIILQRLPSLTSLVSLANLLCNKLNPFKPVGEDRVGGTTET